MDTNIENFHQRRRAFLIIPEIGIIFAERGSVMSHTEILAELGMPQEKIDKIIKTCPRGFYLDEVLVIYQGDTVKEGEAWELSVENYSVVKANFQDMIRVLGLNLHTKIFLGVVRGKLGEEWEHINQVPITFFQ